MPKLPDAPDALFLPYMETDAKYFNGEQTPWDSRHIQSLSCASGIMADILNAVRQAMRAILYGLALSTAIPVLLGLILDVPAGRILTLITSTLVLQANGVFVGLGLGLDPWFVLVVMTFVELGAVLAIYEILETFEESERVKRFTKKTEEGIKKYPYLAKYGAATLIILPAMPIVGLYSSVAVGWLLRWNKLQCIFFITVGWILVVVFLMLVALGFIQAIF